MTNLKPSEITSHHINQISDNEFAMLVTFETTSKQQKVLKDALRADVEHARKEDGNLSMHLYQKSENPNILFLFERWKDREALDAHFEQPYTEEVLNLIETDEKTQMEILYLKDMYPLSPVHYGRSPKNPEEAKELAVVFSVKEGQRQRFIRQFEYSVANSRPEPGCVAFHIHSVDEQPGTFVLYGRWESQTALDRHFEQPYTKELFEVFEEVLDKPLEESMHFMKLLV